MPQLIAWALGAVLGAAAARLMAKEWQRVNDGLDAHGRPDSIGEPDREARPTLKPDPRTGVYRPG